MKNDSWLTQWLDVIRATAADGYVVELGCGNGWDTVDLCSAGVKVIAGDILEENVSECHLAAMDAQVMRLDVSQPLPFANNSVPVILASLSLHYFSWAVTMQIAAELKRCIKKGGILLARFNSTRDYHHGAASGEEIEPNFYRVGRNTKRFFDEDSVRLFLRSWDVRFLEEHIIQRYKKPKSVWEALVIWNG